MTRTFVIAEAGVNHSGSFLDAADLIDEAKKAGASAVKFQMYDTEELDPPGDRRDMLRGYVLNHSEHRDLKAHCDLIGVEYLCTPFDVGSLLFLVNGLGVKRIKIASGHLDNAPLLKAAVASRLPLIVSTGGAALSQLNDAFDTLVKSQTTLLHCASCYPAPVEAMNLTVISTLFDDFGFPVGLSDHTTSLTIPALAVALGASVIEKHLTLDRNAPGPDHKASLEPKEFAEMVSRIREAELALGDGVKRPHPCEAEAMKIMAERKAWRNRTAS